MQFTKHADGSWRVYLLDPQVETKLVINFKTRNSRKEMSFPIVIKDETISSLIFETRRGKPCLYRYGEIDCMTEATAVSEFEGKD